MGELLWYTNGGQTWHLERYSGEFWTSLPCYTCYNVPGQNIGSLAGYPFAPYLSDGLGRRTAIWIGATIMLVGVGVQTASHNLSMFIGARYICIPSDTS